MPRPRAYLYALLTILALLAAAGSRAEPAAPVPMQPGRWLANANATFSADAFAPDGVIDVAKGSVELKDMVFGDGTVEFDMFMPDHGILGLRLRARDRDNAEALYFRPQKDCETSPDCLQYMPLEHGAFEWDLFPEYQAAAPLHLLAWNHVRIALAGRTMRVWVNRADQPALSVERMEGAALSGALIFGGPARYANLVLAPAPAAAPEAPAPEPADGFLRRWRVSPASVLATAPDPASQLALGVQPDYAAMPAPGAAWTDVRAEQKGLVNLSRERGSARDGALVSLAWAKTTLLSERAQTKTVHIGWVREVWVYVNGRLAFAGKNLGDFPAAQVADGRISLENGSFQLPLRQGRNDIAIALDDNLPGNTQHFGWGMELKLDDTDGVAQAPED
jgi:hypothetical protein